MDLTVSNYKEISKQKLSRKEKAELFGIPEWKLKKWVAANKVGRPIPTVRNKRAFKEHTREASYWAGFLAADGCVDDKNRVRIYLQYSDHEHLQKFKDFVGSSHHLNLDKARNRCSFEFTCKPMVEDLLKWNIVPRKSITYQPPVDLPNLPDFLRGLFDGDGTICESFSNKNSKLSTLYTGLACSYKCRDWFKEDVVDALGITMKQYEKENMVSITLNTNKSIVLLKYMYEDSTKAVRLDRKFALYHKTVVLGDRKTRILV